MALLPKVKLKALVNFPANVYGGTGIAVDKASGNFTIDLDYSEFAFQGSLPTGSNVLVWDPVSNVYTLVPPSATGGISDAPTDNKLYGRKNAAWVDAWASPVLTGNPTAPTPSPGDNDTSIATTAFVASAVSTVTISGGVTYTPQTPTAAEQTQARQNIYAAPFDAMAYSGLQINGAMEVSQENGLNAVSVSNTGKYICDGWVLSSSGIQVMQAYSGGGGLAGFPFVLVSKPTTANASPAAADRCTVSTRIEGYRIARLAWGSVSAQPITLAFWVFAARAGNYSGVVTNGGTATRSYPFSFTVAAGVWQYVTVTIPGDTSGTWSTGNGVGMEIFFTLMAGSGNQAPANAWAAGSYFGATGTINGVAATTDQLLIGGVIVLPGNEAPSAVRSPFVMRSFADELALCQRYWEKSYNYATPVASSTGIGIRGNTTLGPGGITNVGSTVAFATRKRATPTIQLYSGTGIAGQFSNSANGTGSFASILPNAIGESSFTFLNGTTTSSDVYFHFTADARL
jgi:hypothetical protein